MKKSMLFAAALLSVSASAFADGIQLKGVMGGGFTFGGDTIAKATYDDGSTYKVHAGGMLAAHAGVEVQFTELVSAQMLIGYHTDRANAENGTIKFERFPLELLGHIRLNDWVRLGGGARYSFRPTVRATGDARQFALDEDFKPMWGSVVEAEFFPLDWFGIKLRYVSETLKSKSQPQLSDLDGSHGGIYFDFYF